MSMTSDSNEKMIPNNGMNSPVIDDANSGGNVGGNNLLKKGPWTSAEDAILVEYVNKHGEGNWNAVQKHSGLARCGKSCRLRWTNNLRPNLRKGAFSPEEERRVIELHAKMGNKWARMAAALPGRTDNEIKNFWNTRIKRRQRAGLPIYPPDIHVLSANANVQGDDMSTFSSGGVHYPDIMLANKFDIPAIEFKCLGYDQRWSPKTLVDIPTSSFLAQDRHSSYPSKRLRGGSQTCFPGLSTATMDNGARVGSLYKNDSSLQIAQPFVLHSSVYDHNSCSNHAPSSSSVLQGSHALLNGNPSSSSEPAWAMKLELPSLQTQVGTTFCSPSSSLPSPDSINTLIQTPPTEQPPPSGNLSRQNRNSGLLDAILHQSHTMKNSKNSSHHQTEREAYGKPTTPFGHSSCSSVFIGGTPISWTSLEETAFEETKFVEKNVTGCKVEEEATILAPLQHDYFSPEKDFTDDHSLLEDAIGALLDDDLRRDCKQTNVFSGSSSDQGRAGGSCARNAMYVV